MCVYTCDYRFDPFTLRWAISNPNKRSPHTEFFCAAFATRLSYEWNGYPPLYTPDSFHSTLLPRRSHVSHWEQFTSIATYFLQPLIWTRDKVSLSLFFFFSPVDFPFQEEKKKNMLKSSAKERITATFTQRSILPILPKGVPKVIFHIITANWAQTDGWRVGRAAPGIRGGMFTLRRRTTLHIYFLCHETRLVFKVGLDFTGCLTRPSVHPYGLGKP